MLETIREDMIKLDYLVRVARQGQERHSFVQYRPTERYRMCTGVKVNPVQKVNNFIQILRESFVLVEIAMHTLVLSAQKFFWMRVSLAALTELRLELLWMVKGSVHLHPKHPRIMITLHDSSLEHCFLDPKSKLLSFQPELKVTEEFLELAREGLTETKPDDKGGKDRRGEQVHQPFENYSEDGV